MCRTRTSSNERGRKSSKKNLESWADMAKPKKLNENDLQGTIEKLNGVKEIKKEVKESSEDICSGEKELLYLE